MLHSPSGCGRRPDKQPEKEKKVKANKSQKDSNKKQIFLIKNNKRDLSSPPTLYDARLQKIQKKN